MAFLQGWKTRILFGCSFAAGVLDELKVVDIKQFLVDLGVPGDKAGAVMIGMSALAIIMREVTVSPTAPIVKRDDAG